VGRETRAEKKRERTRASRTIMEYWFKKVRLGNLKRRGCPGDQGSSKTKKTPRTLDENAGVFKLGNIFYGKVRANHNLVP